MPIKRPKSVLKPKSKAVNESSPEGRAKALGLAKLATSGLTFEDSEVLKFDFLSPEETSKLCSSFRASSVIRINYIMPNGEGMSDWPASPPFYRIRYTERANDFGYQAKKEVRYMQPPNTAPCAYYPQNTDWLPILNDTSTPILITEGELKAAKASKEGFPTIGLGGVYNWRAIEYGKTWIDSLSLITWTKRYVYVVFDSDYKTNPMVCIALKELCEELVRQGALPRVVTLPASVEDQKKMGLDDYLLCHTPDDLQQLLKEAVPYGLVQVLWNLNDKYICVMDPPAVIAKKNKVRMSPNVFRDYVTSSKKYTEKVLRKDGTFSQTPVSAAKAWLEWPHRAEVDKLGYLPGKGELVEDKGIQHYNIWPGWGVQPIEGDHEPFLDLTAHLFSTASKEDHEWFLDWCAYPLQNPGAKLFTSVVIFGVKHGTGKSLLGYTLGRIYGDNFAEISQPDLHNQFNEWAVAKQFALGDDVTGSNKRADNDLLKKMITQREMRVNTKYIPSYTIKDCINYYFTSNQPDAFFLEDDDRRFFIHEIQVPPLDELFYAEYDLWLDTGGSAAVFHYLMQRDLTNFNPSAPAKKTSAKSRMIENVRSDLGSWVRELLENPDYVLRVGKVSLTSDLYTSKDLMALYDPAGTKNTTANGLGRELRRAGVVLAWKGDPLPSPDGGQGRYYMIRRPEVWVAATRGELIDHLTSTSRFLKY